MSFLNGLYETTDIQLNGENSVPDNSTGGAEFYLISTLGEEFVIYIDGTSVFVLNSTTGVLTISSTIDISSPFSVNGVPTALTYRTGGSNSNFNTDLQPFQFIDPTAFYNMAYGTNAMKNITTGDGNAAFGYGALQNLTTGGSNVAFGNLSLTNCTTGILNLAFGYNAGSVMVSSLATTCVGYNAGNSGFQGNWVNLFGINSYIASAGLEYSTCLGTGSFIDANYQVALGRSLDTIIIRGNVGLANTDSTNKIASTAFCQSAVNRLLYLDAVNNQKFYTTKFPALTTGYRNIGIGDCMNALTSGGDNCCIGSGSMTKLTTGTENFCLGGLSMREITTGSFNVSVGVQNLANGVTNSGNIAIGRYIMGAEFGNENTGIGYFSMVQHTSGNLNTMLGAYSGYDYQIGSNNTIIGTYAGTSTGGLINASNNTFIGAETRMDTTGGAMYNNSTCIGYNSRIKSSNGIFLGTATETTYPVGGLNIPSGQLLTLVGNIFANATTITPVNVSALSTVSGNIVDTGTVSQQIAARKDFNGFDNTIPNYCGSSFVSPVFRPRLFSLFNSINYSCHAFGSNCARNLLADGTNSGCYILGQDNLYLKTQNTSNVQSIGGSNMISFTNENLASVTLLGQGNLSNGSETGYSMSNVAIFGGGIQFTDTGVFPVIKPTSVSNACFMNAYGIKLTANSAISNVFAIRTLQPITKSNQGIIGDSTEITLHSTGQKVIVTGTLECDEAFSASIFSPTLNWSSANFNLSATTKFLMYYHFILNAATTITLPAVTAAMVGQQFTFKRRGGGAFILSLQTSGSPVQPVFPTGSSLGTFAFPYALISATQSVAQLMCIQSHFAGSGTGSTTIGSNVLTVNTWGTLPSAMITIGTVISLGAVTKRVSAFGTGRGGTGTYTMDTTYAATTISPQPITSTDMFGYDILNVQ